MLHLGRIEKINIFLILCFTKKKLKIIKYYIAHNLLFILLNIFMYLVSKKIITFFFSEQKNQILYLMHVAYMGH